MGYSEVAGVVIIAEDADISVFGFAPDAIDTGDSCTVTGADADSDSSLTSK